MRHGSLAPTLGLSLLAVALVSAQDWPQWRGPNRDGAIASFRAPAAWPGKLVRQWQVDVGTGYSTPVLIGDRLYAFTRQGDEEVMTALDPATSKTIWRSSYPAPFAMNPATRRHGPGPKSTPAFAGGRLFTLGMTGAVTAFDAQTGKQVWQKPGTPAQPEYHTAVSPAVDGNLVIVHVGGPGDAALTAFDAATGDVRWAWTGDSPAYGSPVVADLGGTRQLVTFTHQYFVGVSVATGQLLWRRPYRTPADTTSQTPILYKDLVIESGRSNGITAFRVVQQGGGWTTEDVWHTDEVSAHMSDAVAVENTLFGLSHLNRGQYFALDLDSGKVLWKSEGRLAEHAALSRAGQTIFSLQDDGTLVVVRSSRTAFEPIARYEVAASETWPQPVISGNRVFVKDVSSLALWTFE